MQNRLIAATNAGINRPVLPDGFHFFSFINRLQSGTLIFSIFELDTNFDTAAFLFSLFLSLLLFDVDSLYLDTTCYFNKIGTF